MSKNRLNKDDANDKNRKVWIALIIIYMFVIIKLIIFKYPVERLLTIMEGWDSDAIRRGVNSANFELFKTIKMYIHYYARLNSFENLFGNILIFIPFGFLIPHALPAMRKFRWIFISSFLFILDIELFQLVTRFGEFDVDDILLNMTGVIIGHIIYCASICIRKKFDNLKK